MELEPGSDAGPPVLDQLSTQQQQQRQQQHHRRIALQSPQDLAHLHAQTVRAARRKIDAAFPPSAAPGDGEDDALRRSVETVVARFVDGTWTAARRNCEVGGVVFGAALGEAEAEADGVSGQDYEALDLKMVERIRTLEAEKERLTLKVTGLRREGPLKAAQRFRTRWEEQEQEQEAGTRREVSERVLSSTATATATTTAAAAAAEEEEREDATPLDLDLDLDLHYPVRWEDVMAAYERGARGLLGLRVEMTETVARLERAREVVGYVQGQ